MVDELTTAALPQEKEPLHVVDNSSRQCKGCQFQMPVYVAALANLSAAYNFTIIDYALLLMAKEFGQSSGQLTSLIASCSIFGAITGQLMFGYIGGAIGRRKGMILTLAIGILGALSSAFLPHGKHAYKTLAFCRFVLGIGIGGVYPLSAATAAESSQNPDTLNGRIAFAFSFQGLGQLLVPLCVVSCTSVIPNAEVSWRLLLAVGALPGLSVLKHAVDMVESEEYVDASKKPTHMSLMEALYQPKYRKTLAGTALGWFFFDITFYGNIIFTPTILEDVFGWSKSNIDQAALYAMIVSAIALPGYFLAVWSANRLGFRFIQLQGFLLMAFLFLVLGFGFDTLIDQKQMLFFLYALTFFFSNFGPNVSTFCIPAEVFPVDVRAQFNGISAATGKLGAAVGASLFKPMEAEYGVQMVLVFSGVVSVVGYLVTYLLVQDPQKETKVTYNTQVDEDAEA